jgi:hypothetical protein
MFVCNFTDFIDVGSGHQTTAPPTSYGIYFVSGISNVNKDAGLKNFMMRPFALVLGDNRRIKIVMIFGTDVSDSDFPSVFLDYNQ